MGITPYADTLNAAVFDYSSRDAGEKFNAVLLTQVQPREAQTFSIARNHDLWARGALITFGMLPEVRAIRDLPGSDTRG